MHKFLLVEDDPDDFFIAEDCLSQAFPHGMSLDWVKTVAQGLEHAQNNSYDLCLIDHQLGPESGLTLIQELASCNPELLTVMLTGANDPELDRLAIDAGAMDYVMKSELTPRFIERAFRHAAHRKSKELQLRWARQKSDRAQNVMKQLLANITHELRSPLIGIMELSTQLEGAPNCESLSATADDIKRTAKVSLELVDDLLHYSKYESGKIKLENRDFCIQVIAEEALAIVKPRARNKDLALSMVVELDHTQFRGDPTRIRQIMTNLLSNSVKFTHEGSVTLRIKGSPRNDGLFFVTFAIEDTGIGIAQEKLDQIFEPFAQADPTIYRRYGGTGLGLAITRGLVEMMNGHIEVDSTLGSGSSFRFILPLKAVEAIAETAAYQSFQNIRALVADDNPISLRMARRLLEKFSVATDIACDGFEAIELMGKNHYDLILLDINMPRLDGFETATAIRQRFVKQPYIVAQTAHLSEDIQAQCLSAGMNSVWTKPLGKNSIHKILKETEQHH